MPIRHRFVRLVVLAAAAAGAALLTALFMGLPAIKAAGAAAAAVVAVALAALPGSAFAIPDDLLAAPTFAVNLVTLLVFGPAPALAVAAAGAVAPALADASSSRKPQDVAVNTVAAMLATAAAGFTLSSFGGGSWTAWPWKALPLAAAAVTYCGVRPAPVALLAIFTSGKHAAVSLFNRAIARAPDYLLSAGIAAGVGEILQQHLWALIPVVLVPLACGYRRYCEYAADLHLKERCRGLSAVLGEGLALVDDRGKITLWTDPLQSVLGCPARKAAGRTIADAVPALRSTMAPQAVLDTIADRTERVVRRVVVQTGQPPRIASVRIVPVAEGAALIWTGHRPEQQEIERTGERLMLAADGARDGLWEWDLRTGELYCSSRWRSMIGLPATPAVGTVAEWMQRVHPEDLVALRASLDQFTSKADQEPLQHEYRMRHEDGSYRRFLTCGTAMRGTNERAQRVAGSLTDTTEHALAQERLRTAGFVDALTGLCNRAVFVETLGRRLHEFKDRRGSTGFAVLYLDLDRFKVVNDSLGHLVGDELLIAVSRRLESCLRYGDALARLGGDEFAILLNGLSDQTQANAIAFRIQETLSSPFSISGREVFTSASIGIAFGRVQYVNPDDIMRDADTAMYQAKARGKARHELFDADMHARVRDRLGLENDLRRAVAAHDFEVYYQPIVSLASGMCVGFESLVRWNRNGEPISPATFIPIAEELGLIEPIGTWVMQQACRTFATWKKRFPASRLDCITVNVSSRQLLQQNFLRIVEHAVEEARLEPRDVRVEITETALMDNPTAVADVLRELREYGVKIYLDDFGTGYSSLSHLHKLPVDALKIDRSFVRSLLLPERPAIVESILGLARTLNTSVVAEGIESNQQALELKRLGCTHAQGFLFSKPLPARAVEEMLTANRPLGPGLEPAAPATREDGTQPWRPSTPAEWPAEPTPRVNAPANP